MAPQAFCCDKIRSTTFEAEDYRLGLFINWAKAKDKRAPTKDKNLGLNVPFCVQVFQRPSLRSTRLFVPTGWYEFAEIDWKLLGAPWVSHGPSHYQCRIHRTAYRVTLYERSVKSPTLPPTASASSNIKVPDQRGRGDASSSTAINEPTNVARKLDASTNPSAENDHTESPGTDVKYHMEYIASLVNMPAGQYVLDSIKWARNTMRLNEVSLSTEAEILKICFFRDLHKLRTSIDHNISIWMLLTTADPIAKLLMSCSPSNSYTKDDRAKILQATAAAVNVVHCLAIGQYEAQDGNPPDFIDVFQEICRQHPDDEYLTSLVNRAVAQLTENIEAEEEEHNKAGLAERKVYPSVNEDDDYDQCELSA